jgi:hypothetical protein
LLPVFVIQKVVRSPQNGKARYGALSTFYIPARTPLVYGDGLFMRMVGARHVRGAGRSRHNLRRRLSCLLNAELQTKVRVTLFVGLVANSTTGMLQKTLWLFREIITHSLISPLTFKADGLSETCNLMG